MKISYNWLKEFIQLDLEPEKISKILTDIGLEVESVELFQTIKGGLQGIVIGKVITCDKHPNADKLHVTTVNVGNNTILPIVCGAPNVAAGQTVLVATEGTKLYDGDKEFIIKNSKIRGEVSEGMLCAEDELGMGTSHDGIMVLPNEIAAGTLAKDYFNIQDDYIFEIGLTPNRIDAASHYGVARDLAAYFSVQGNAKLTKPSIDSFIDNSDKKPFQVIVENPKDCPRYCGVAITNVTVKESPEWLKNRLKSIGQKSINNIVDVTNLVLHELAQPLHAFDLSKIEGNQIIVKTVANNTKFITLDGIERELSSDDLIICNAQSPMCIAGVLGGKESGVTDQTTAIFLESAYFNPVTIRKTAKRHGLSTDASFRFERGIDPNNTVFALKRAALLIQEIAGGTISSSIFDSNSEKFPAFAIELSFSKIKSLIGKNIDSAVIERILEALEITIIAKNNDSISVEVPAYRVDVQRQEDIVEEILRIYGYNNIEIPTAVKSSLSYSSKINDTHLKNVISDLLVSSGWNEIMNNSLTRSSYYTNAEKQIHEHIVPILNPLSTELDCMRNSLLFGCLEVLAFNNNRQMSDIAIFEFGRVYSKTGSEGDVTKKYAENQHLALCLLGKQQAQYWGEKQNDHDIFELKSSIQKILLKLGFKDLTFSSFENELFRGLECKAKNVVVAQLGMVSKSITKRFDIDKPCYFAQLHWDTILSKYNSSTKYKEIPQFPEVRRDLSLLINKSITFEKIEEIAFSTERKLLKNINVFDVYEGKGIPEGKKSYAVSFILQDEQKTLTDVQIDAVMNKLIVKFKQELEAELR